MFMEVLPSSTRASAYACCPEAILIAVNSPHGVDIQLGLDDGQYRFGRTPHHELGALDRWAASALQEAHMSTLAPETVRGAFIHKPAASFQRILLPIDGSELSLHAFEIGLELAKTFSARAVALHVVPPYNAIAYMAEFLAAAELRYSQHAVESASRYLDQAKLMAKAADVPCECHFVFGEHPYRAILEAAKEHHCDLIVMATHGRHGANRYLLGSETQKVLMHSRVPVLVCR